MSLVYAHKTFLGIRVLSDSKLTINPNDEERLNKLLNAAEVKNMKKYGVIKTIIYKPTITISAAGILEYFNELIDILKTNNIENIEEILKNATNIHIKYNREIDFIVTTEKDIYEIKNGKYLNVDSCWIGDSQAFSVFQKEKLCYKVGKNSYIVEGLSKNELEALKTIEIINHAFEKVINNTIIESVGGFLVICSNLQIDNREYVFLPSVINFNEFSFRQIIYYDHDIMLSNNTYDDGFKCQILDSKNKFLIYIAQEKLGIVYMEGYSNKDYCNLLLPIIVYSEYKDFIDKYSDTKQSFELC